MRQVVPPGAFWGFLESPEPFWTSWSVLRPPEASLAMLVLLGSIGLRKLRVRENPQWNYDANAKCHCLLLLLVDIARCQYYLCIT